MTRFLVLLSFPLLISTALLGEESIGDINKKISNTKNTINKQKKAQKKIKANINVLASQIIKARKKLRRLSKNQKTLELEIKILSRDSRDKQKEIKNLESLKEKLVKTRQKTEIKLIDLMAKNLSKTLILDKMEETSANDIIKKEIFKKVKEFSNQEIKKLKTDFLNTQNKVASLENRIEKISKSLNTLIDKKEKVAKLKNEERQVLASLSKKQNRYSKKLADIISRKKRSRDLLAQLGIIKSNALKKVQAAEERDRLARASKNRRNVKQSNTKVRKHGSSYLAVGKNHYRGRKVKPPIDDKSAFKVTKKFGPFVDPIYDIKIHNDYVTLRADKENSVIRNVLNGKVVFADTLPMLGKVVIVDHKNGIHTIYRKLNQISPNVRVKNRIKQREAIGRIDRDLEFEVTKDSIPINPLELIRVPKRYISSL
ncbi:MAG: peptidoglycan DD-metalloendopeptidase family protein [Campylobacterales bacterium]|nr:peptidoglycan DD-metalloendopeptidase family protein [Campylobacterales bacterium]